MKAAGPNPWKVLIILEELGVPYEINSFPFEKVKQKPFTDVNPNGRVPGKMTSISFHKSRPFNLVIEDPNTGLTLWEAGAIILYLIEHTICSTNTFFFQVSGQGPYFGQAGWFNVLHSTKIPSAIQRYNGQLKRVLSVLGTLLEGKQWLFGGKMTYADLSFGTWNDRIDSLILCAPEDKFKGFPNVQAWQERMMSRTSWDVCMKKRAVLMDEQGLLSNRMPKGVSNMEEYQAKIKADAEASK